MQYLSKELGDNIPFLHLVSFMHQVSLPVGACYSPLKVIRPMFCACNLIRRSRWHVQVSGAVLKWASKVQVTDQ